MPSRAVQHPARGVSARAGKLEDKPLFNTSFLTTPTMDSSGMPSTSAMNAATTSSSVTSVPMNSEVGSWVA
jgi:hypothetical protein